MKNILRTNLVLLLLAGLFATSCDSFLEPSVDQNKPTETAIQSVSDLQAFVEGIHDDISGTGLYGRDFYVSGDVMSDNALSNGNSGRFIDQDLFSFTPNSGYAAGVWNGFYEAIAGANIVINESSLEASPQVSYAKGQAYALRALSHMNLLLAFGQQFVTGGDPNDGIPYVTVYNDESEFYPERDPIAAVWTNIGDDLSQAVTLMDPALESANPDPVYMNTLAVQALLSRYHLYTENFQDAIDAADYVINNGPYSLIADSAALKDAWEAGTGPNSIFEIAMTNTDNRGTNSIARIYRNSNYGDVEATDDLYLAHDSDDDRLSLYRVYDSPEDDANLVDFDPAETNVVRMTSKYITLSGPSAGSDNVRVIRFAEVVLNKAEALARRGEGTDLADALAIINDLSSKRGSSRVYTSLTQEDVIADVLAERRLELAMEGHRLYDLLRHGMGVPAHEGQSTAIAPGDYRLALPIPQGERDANSNIGQNEGYN